MRKSLLCCFTLFVLFLGNKSFGVTRTADPIEALIHRIAPAYEKQIVFEKIGNDHGMDVFELEYADNKLIIRGNNYNSMAVGLNHYLKYYCRVFISWYNIEKPELPAKMPSIPIKVRQIARVKDRFFLNYCTFGYTMPWWRWNEWERLIDWMALNGINMPLATTGEEAIYYKVWSKLGLNDRQIRTYFTGPAYLPWHRMANIDHWEGPLPHSWLRNQLVLQKKIVSREREMNMKPVLPAFAGHVPEAIKSVFPKAKITRLGKWGGFSEKYESNFLDPFDPLFKKIQRSFLEEQKKAFGTDHIYGADPFNEVTPPSWERDYLAAVSKTIYGSMTEADPNAIWLQMSWLFYIDRDKWTNERIKSFITAVPQGKMILLDYYCENTEVWKMTSSFFGQPYLWCYLGNFGGNTMLAGNLREVGKRMENAFKNGGDNLSGIGSTLEGFDVNPVMYDFVFEKAWSADSINVNSYINHWAEMRGGAENDAIKKAWGVLLNTAYTSPAQLGQGMLTDAKPGLKGHGNWTTNPNIVYSNIDLLNAWRLLLNADLKDKSYRYDLVNVGRQVLGNYFSVLRDGFSESYEAKDIQAMHEKEAQMLELFDDLDSLLSTQSSFLLGKWLDDARSFGKTPTERNYYEKDARTIITVWGGEQRSLNDYANRALAGLTKSFYKERWQLFLDSIIRSVKMHQAFDEKTFIRQLNKMEDQWILRHEHYSNRPVGSSLEISKTLYAKYAGAIINKKR